jgi:hypothetical protein
MFIPRFFYIADIVSVCKMPTAKLLICKYHAGQAAMSEAILLLSGN